MIIDCLALLKYDAMFIAFFNFEAWLEHFQPALAMNEFIVGVLFSILREQYKQLQEWQCKVSWDLYC